MTSNKKTGFLVGNYGKTGIGTVEKHGFKPYTEHRKDSELVDSFVNPEIFLGRTINNLLGGRYVRKKLDEFDRFFFVCQDQVAIDPAKYDTEIVVYVHDLFPVTTVYDKGFTSTSIIDTIREYLLALTHLKAGRLINNADQVIAPCKKVAEDLEKRTTQENIEYAYQGFDHLPEEKLDKERDIDLLYFGDLVHSRKNPELVRKVFREANKRGYTTAYMNNSPDEKIEADHEFISVSDEKVAEVLSRSRFLFQPSRAEGLGRTPLEAQKQGCMPIVKTRTQYYDVAQEMLGVENDQWASIDQMDDLWTILNTNIVKRERIRENASRFTWEKFHRKIEEVLEH